MNYSNYPQAIKREWLELFKPPKDPVFVEQVSRTRNDQEVEVLRFQEQEPKELDVPHVSFLLSRETGELLSYVNNFIKPAELTMSQTDAIEKTKAVLDDVNKSYAKGLSYMRTDQLPRFFINANGEREEFFVHWVKFAHQTGYFNWVGFAGNGTIKEFEVKEQWDFFRMRRKQEWWDNDDWVKSRLGTGTELERPLPKAWS